MSDQKTMTVSEAASQLGIGKNGAYDAIKRGEIPAVRIGRRLLVPLDAVDRLLNRALDKAQ